MVFLVKMNSLKKFFDITKDREDKALTATSSARAPTPPHVDSSVFATTEIPQSLLVGTNLLLGLLL